MISYPGPHVEFTQPPIIEVALSIAFEPLPLTTQHLIEVWESKLKDSHPNLEIQPPFEMPIEPLEAIAGPQLAFQFSAFPTSHRVWALDTDKNHLVQLQRDFVATNWRRLDSPGDAYPRFGEMRLRLRDMLEGVTRHLQERGLGPIRPVQVEVTYINHVVAPHGQRPYRLDEVLRLVSDHAIDSKLAEMEPGRLAVSYPLWRGERRVGRLHVTADPATRKNDLSHVMVLTTTVRGVPEDPTLESAQAFIDDGAATAFTAFLGMTTDTIQRAWGRKDL